MVKKAKRYNIVKVEEPVHRNLHRLLALRELQTGKRPTMSELIEELIDQQPTYEITAEEVEEKQ